MRSRYRFLTFVPLAMAAFAQDSVTTSLSGGVFSGFAHFGAVRAEHVMTVTGAPYSAEETFTLVQTLMDGTQITRASTMEKVFRDSAGRLRIERTAVPGRLARKQGFEVPVIVELTDPVEHVRYTLDTVNKVAHKQPLTVPLARSERVDSGHLTSCPIEHLATLAIWGPIRPGWMVFGLMSLELSEEC